MDLVGMCDRQNSGVHNKIAFNLGLGVTEDRI